MTHCAICHMAGIETIATQHIGNQALCDDCHFAYQESFFDINKWAASHHCSIEVAEAIEAAAKSVEEMERIWQDPTEDELVFIYDYATEEDTIDATFMDWGKTTLARLRADLDV